MYAREFQKTREDNEKQGMKSMQSHQIYVLRMTMAVLEVVWNSIKLMINPPALSIFRVVMAIRFKQLGKRSLSAVVFVFLLLGSVYWSYFSFSLFFLVAALIGLHELYKLFMATGAAPYRLAGLIAGAITYFAFLRWDLIFDEEIDIPRIELLACLPLLFLFLSLFDKQPGSFRNAFISFGGIFYVVLPFALLHELVVAGFMSKEYTPMFLIGVILLIWVNDTFAYLWGSLFGKRKLLERVSPGKTWEGTILGALSTFGAGFIISSWEDYAEGMFWPLLGLMIPVAATIGDLAESHLKRIAGVKDSGNIMPGHGGVLDRFDSLLFVSPLVVLIVKLFS
jgi:phosphatidate cytidylyltransferase